MASRTYTGTTFYPTNLEDATVRLYIHDNVKYYSGEDATTERVDLTGLTSWTIVEGGEEAEAIEKLVEFVDEEHEYLILRFTNGKTEIYRNSLVTMFII